MFLATRALSAAMKKQDLKIVNTSNSRRGATRGVIVNMGSCSSHVATPQLGQYTTSKHAVLGLTRNAGKLLTQPKTSGFFLTLLAMLESG